MSNEPVDVDSDILSCLHYRGTFPLHWLRDDEDVGAAKKGGGSCEVFRRKLSVCTVDQGDYLIREHDGSLIVLRARAPADEAARKVAEALATLVENAEVIIGWAGPYPDGTPRALGIWRLKDMGERADEGDWCGPLLGSGPTLDAAIVAAGVETNQAGAGDAGSDATRSAGSSTVAPSSAPAPSPPPAPAPEADQPAGIGVTREALWLGGTHDNARINIHPCALHPTHTAVCMEAVGVGRVEGLAVEAAQTPAPEAAWLSADSRLARPNQAQPVGTVTPAVSEAAAGSALYVRVEPIKLAPRWDRYGVPPSMATGWGDACGDRVVGVSLLAHMVEAVERERDEMKAAASRFEASALEWTRRALDAEKERDDARAALAGRQGRGESGETTKARDALVNTINHAMPISHESGRKAGAIVEALDAYLLAAQGRAR